LSTQTEAVLLRHLQAASVGVDAVMADYVDASVIITHAGTYRRSLYMHRPSWFLRCAKKPPVLSTWSVTHLVVR
jgi:hypothetical protein